MTYKWWILLVILLRLDRGGASSVVFFNSLITGNSEFIHDPVTKALYERLFSLSFAFYLFGSHLYPQFPHLFMVLLEPRNPVQNEYPRCLLLLHTRNYMSKIFCPLDKIISCVWICHHCRTQ